jgi:hypothetical protein
MHLALIINQMREAAANRAVVAAIASAAVAASAATG